MNRKDITDLEIYNLSMEIAEDIWKIVSNWEGFAKNSLGFQFIKSSDSIAANLAEGYGRHYYKENRQFCFIARGSLYETKTFLQKSFNRKLVVDEHYNSLSLKLEKLMKMLNAYIRYINSFIEKYD